MFSQVAMIFVLQTPKILEWFNTVFIEICNGLVATGYVVCSFVHCWAPTPLGRYWVQKIEASSPLSHYNYFEMYWDHEAHARMLAELALSETSWNPFKTIFSWALQECMSDAFFTSLNSADNDVFQWKRLENVQKNANFIWKISFIPLFLEKCVFWSVFHIVCKNRVFEGFWT